MSMHPRAQRMLTHLALVLPVSFGAQTALADALGPCPNNMVLYGEWAGGFCCDGSVDPNTSSCNGSVCALDPTQTQGNPLCYEEYSPICRNMGSKHFYGGLMGGFCCNGTLGANLDTCDGTVCALSAASTQGNPLCTPITAECPTGQERYGEWAGGFCCDGMVDALGDTCSGTICALDPGRSQGHILCATTMPSCSPWQTRYGELLGGFCCEGDVTGGSTTDGSCNGSVCALDPLRTQGNPLCDDVAPPAQGVTGDLEFFSSSPTGGIPFRLIAATASIQSTTNGVSISGDITIAGGEHRPAITLTNAQIDLMFDSNGYISTLIGTARVSMPSTGGFSTNDLGVVTLGLDWGANLGNPNNQHHVEAPMKDDRQYLVLHIAGGLSGGYGPVSFSAPMGIDTLLVVDPRDPSVYFHGNIPNVPGLGSIGPVGIGISVRGLLPFEHQTTWGIEHFVEDFDGHVVLEGPIPFSNALLSGEGQATVRLPSSTDPITRIGMNGTISVGVDFVPGIASFSVDVGNATVGGIFDASSDGEAYFSAYAGTQGFIDALPDLSIIPDVGVNVAGRLSTIPANNHLRVAGHGRFSGYDVASLDMSFSPTGVWASGNFQLGSGFRANLSGKVMATYADLKGEAYVNIPIFGAKEIVSGTWQTMNYVKNGAECSWTTAANGTECGWQNFTSEFCKTFPWLCTPEPVTCTFANSCTKQVWVQQSITEPNFNYGSFTAKAHFHVSTPQDVTVDFTNTVCPASVGSCSVGVEDLQTTNPKLCVTSSMFGKFCQPLQIHAPTSN